MQQRSTSLRAVAFGALASLVALVGCGRAPESGADEAIGAQSQAVAAADAGSCTAGASGLTTSPLELQVLTNSCGANQIQQFFQVVNGGAYPVKLSDITIKYWIDDTSGQAVVPSTPTGGCVQNPSCSHQVTGVAIHAQEFSPACGPSSSQQANWEITLSTSDSTLLPAGATWTNLQSVLTLKNWSNFVPGPANWYSPCGTATTYASNPNFALYYQGSLVFSQGISAPSCRAPQRAQAAPGYVQPPTSPVVGPLPPTTVIPLTVVLPMQNEPALQALVAQASDPTSPSYRQYLTPDQLLSNYAPSSAAYGQLVAWAQSKNLQVRTYPHRLGVTLTGTAEQVEQALLVNLVQAKRPDGTLFYEADRQPSLDLCVPIQSLTGVDNFQVPTRKSTASAPGGAFSASDLRAAYLGTNTACSSLTGAGQGIGLVEFQGFDPSQITLYEAQMNLSGVPPVQVQTTDGVTLPVTTYQEMYGDIEMANALAPAAQVIAFEDSTYSTDPPLLAILNTPGVYQISSSWYSSFSSATASLLLAVAAEGKSFFDATGDFGAFEPVTSSCAGTTVPPPYTDVITQGYITSVGGTVLNTNGAPGYSGETTWLGSAGGVYVPGGQYAGVPIPIYQVGANPKNTQVSSTFLNAPDVAIVSTGQYGVVPGYQGGIAGTSYAAPLWAAFLALANQSLGGPTGLGFINPAIYQIGKNPKRYANAFHDINDNSTNENACGVSFTATQGYDLTTGWGSPKCGLITELACATCGGSACINLDTDANNCGACAHACSSGICVAGTCQAAGCTNWYPDCDQDGYGNPQGVPFYSCTQPTVTPACPNGMTGAYANNSGDCCDLDANAHPGQSQFFAYPDVCGSFDYNCDGTQTQQSNGPTDCFQNGMCVLNSTQTACVWTGLPPDCNGGPTNYNTAPCGEPWYDETAACGINSLGTCVAASNGGPMGIQACN
ncbi:MAG: protease pro-enzyme activation domain-containing protein [Polyangiaceae bacterium]|jgi:hypothetical protein